LESFFHIELWQGTPKLDQSDPRRAVNNFLDFCASSSGRLVTKVVGQYPPVIAEEISNHALLSETTDCYEFQQKILVDRILNAEHDSYEDE